MRLSYDMCADKDQESKLDSVMIMMREQARNAIIIREATVQVS